VCTAVVEGGNGALLSLPSRQETHGGLQLGLVLGDWGAGLVQASGVPWSAGVGSSGVRVSCGRVGWGFLCEVTLSVGALCFSVVPTVPALRTALAVVGVLVGAVLGLG